MLPQKFIILDFDSTFIQVEAFDELGKISLVNNPNKEQLVKQIEDITNQGMNGELSITTSLMERIKLLQAKKSHLYILIKELQNKITPSIKHNANFFKQFADNVFIVSSGFKEYVLPIVASLGIRESHVFANTFIYDKNDNIIGLDESNLLCKNKGKVEVVRNLNLSGDIYVIGDGYTDYEISEALSKTKFYAFTENITRKLVVDKADYIIPNFDEFLYQNDLPMSISYPKNRIKILLLENIHPVAYALLKDEGYTIESLKSGMNEDELCEKIKDISVLGIRSKTSVSKKVLDNAHKLMAIGAFCIGTNQIALDEATKHGISVFNAPYSNTRSVVELVIGEIIMLMRKVIAKNNKLHQGIWDKSAENSYEIRGKKLGIIGYGNIGSQLSVLAESLGMHIYFYDTIEKLHLGNAKKCNTLDELLQISDIVTVHVDGRLENEHLIGKKELSLMRDNAIFINLSRGHVVDLGALVASLKSGKFLGVGIDVFPYEPKNNQEEFVNELRSFENVILTPHIGGSTEEAQLNIGEFVARRIINYINMGDTTQSVNLPNVQLPVLQNAHRLIHLHANVPGILAQINQLFAKHDINVLWQSLRTNEQVGYIITDINKTFDTALIDQLRRITHTIKFRVLY